jgi:hypothetical protein
MLRPRPRLAPVTNANLRVDVFVVDVFVVDMFVVDMVAPWASWCRDSKLAAGWSAVVGRAIPGQPVRV